LSNAFIGRIGRTIAHWRKARYGIRRLQQLDDRMLADIDITRGEIYSAAIRGRQR